MCQSITKCPNLVEPIYDLRIFRHQIRITKFQEFVKDLDSRREAEAIWPTNQQRVHQSFVLFFIWAEVFTKNPSDKKFDMRRQNDEFSSNLIVLIKLRFLKLLFN